MPKSILVYSLIFIFCFSGAFATLDGSEEESFPLHPLRSFNKAPREKNFSFETYGFLLDKSKIQSSRCSACEEKAAEFWKKHNERGPYFMISATSYADYLFKQPSKCFSCSAKEFFEERIPNFFK